MRREEYHGNTSGGPGSARGRFGGDGRATMVGREPVRYAGQPGGAAPWWTSRAAKAGALVLVAVLSGLIWWATHRGADTQATAAGPVPAGHPEPAGQGVFQSVRGPIGDTDCARQSYGKARRFFERTPCTALSRQLYSSTEAGRRVLTSVSTVTMPDASAAAALKGLTDANGTGNVTDLVSAGARLPGGPTSLKGSGYSSVQEGARVRIAESGYFSGPNDPDSTNLKKVSDAALRMG